MKRVLIGLVVAAQLAVLVSMAAQREWISRHGRQIRLRTVPIDPTDYMRGEYARLNYEISNVPGKFFRDGIVAWKNAAGSFRHPHRDAPVYAILQVDPDGLAHLAGLTDREPSSGVYLRGRVAYFYENSARVRYGIEAMFMEEGAAAKFESDARDRAQQTVIVADVAVSADGTAVLKATHREPLGHAPKGDPAVLPKLAP